MPITLNNLTLLWFSAVERALIFSFAGKRRSEEPKKNEHKNGWTEANMNESIGICDGMTYLLSVISAIRVPHKCWKSHQFHKNFDQILLWRRTIFFFFFYSLFAFESEHSARMHKWYEICMLSAEVYQIKRTMPAMLLPENVFVV